MKKLLTGIIALTFVLSTVVSAAEYKITAPGTEQIREGTYEEGIQSADISMMVSTAVVGLTDTKDVFTQISIETKNDKPSVATLKLFIPEGKIKDGNNAIDYMDLKITSSDGTVIFEENEGTQKGENEQSIFLGVLNENGEDYSDTIDIYISANDNMKLAELANRPLDVEWAIELDSDQEAVAAAKQTARAGNNMPEKTITVVVDRATDKDGGKVAAGDYGLTGIGTCTIKTPDGKRDVSFTLSEKESEAVFVQLREGDEIIVTGGSNAKLQLLNPQTTTKTNVTSQANTTTKTNPKTGDASPVALVSAVALLAALSMVYAARNKKRED